jgi:hypothetical protein
VDGGGKGYGCEFVLSDLLLSPSLSELNWQKLSHPEEIERAVLCIFML